MLTNILKVLISLLLRAAWIVALAFAAFVIAFGTAGASSSAAFITFLLGSLVFFLLAAPACVPLSTMRFNPRAVLSAAFLIWLVSCGFYALMVAMK